jgi:hypothetical protein
MTVSWLPGAGEVDCQIIEDEQKNEYGEKLWRLQHKKDYLGDELMQITHDQFWGMARIKINFEAYSHVVKEADSKGQGGVTEIRVRETSRQLLVERDFPPSIVTGWHNDNGIGANFGSGMAYDSNIIPYGLDGFDGFRFNMEDWNGEQRDWAVYDTANSGSWSSTLIIPRAPSYLPVSGYTTFVYWDYGIVKYNDVADYAITKDSFEKIIAYRMFDKKYTHAYASKIPCPDTTVIRYSSGTIRVNYKRFTGDPAPEYEIPVIIEIRNCPSYTSGQWYKSGDRWLHY